MTIEEERLTRLERLFDRFNISSTDGITVEGSLHTGYAIDTSAIRGRGGTGIIGACCVGSSCFRTTESNCITSGGIYFGDGTLCVPGVCGGVGACCIGESCSSLTESDCISAGGVFQGAGTSCSPNPCILPSCNGCGYNAFDGSGRVFLTEQLHVTGSSTHEVTEFCANFASASYEETEILSYDESCTLFSRFQFGHHESTNCDGIHCTDGTYTTSCSRSFCAVDCVTTDMTISATEKIVTTTCHGDGVCHTETVSVFTLYDECEP